MSRPILHRIVWAIIAVLLSLPVLTAPSLPVPGRGVLLLAAVAALACWRPAIALATIGALIPIAQWLGRRWAGDIVWPDALVLAFAAGAALHYTFSRDVRHPPDRVLRCACAAAAAVVLASWLVDLSLKVQLEGLAGASPWIRLLADPVLTGGRTPSGAMASILLRGILLFAAAAHFARTEPLFRFLSPRLAIVGAAAASVVTIVKLFRAAQRFPDYWSTFFDYLWTVRFSAHYSDVNAAGSYYVLILFVAIAVAIKAHGWHRSAWLACTALVGAGLWVSGSRTAMLCGVVAGAIPATALALHARSVLVRRRVMMIAAIAVVAGVIVLALAAYLPFRTLQSSPLSALRVRAGLAEASFRMLAGNPLFGIGVGQYPARSAEFSTIDLLLLFPQARYENAHNNFLQITAELGLVGLAAFVSIFWLTWHRAAAAMRGTRRVVTAGMAIGVVAHMMTWLAGHPLLTAAVAYSFWLLLGTLAGQTVAIVPARAPVPRLNDAAPQPAPSAGRVRALSWATAVFVVLLAASLPWRVRQYTSAANLEHFGIGVSPRWETADDGSRYRWAGTRSSVFVPAQARAFKVRLRAPGAGDSVQVELRLDGRTADRIRVDADSWTTVTELLPEAKARVRFIRLDLTVLPPDDSSDQRVLMIGKVEPM
jgi:hypothetical protein